MMDEAYHRHNLFYREYTPDVVEHWVRYHFTALRVLRDAGDIDAICVYSDLTSAISKLSDTQKRVIQMLTDGYTLSHVSATLRCNASRTSRLAYQAMSRFLIKTTDSVET